MDLEFTGRARFGGVGCWTLGVRAEVEDARSEAGHGFPDVEARR